MNLLILLAFSLVVTKYLIDKLRRAMPKDLDELFKAMDRFSTRDFIKLRLLHRHVVFVNNPQLIHKVLASDVCLEKPQLIYKLLNINDGLLASKLSKWRHDRRYFSSSFNNSMVECFIPTFCCMADKMVHKISGNHLGGQEFDMIHFTERCTIEMIFGSSFDAFTEDVEDGEASLDNVANCVKTTSSLLSERFRHFPWFFDFVFKLSSIYRREKLDREFMFGVLMDIVKRKSIKRELQHESTSFSDNTFLNRLLKRKHQMTDRQLRDHVFTITGAGYETTGTASAHCVLLLALNPKVQEKAFEEIMKVFPSEDSPITAESLSQLDYLERVMRESLRLAPTVHAIAREAVEDFEISQGNLIPKGSIFVINIYGLHRRDDLWGSDASDFQPDRFLPENFSDKQQFFIPFSAGKRNCIGYRYAFVSFKIMMLKLLRSFKFATTLKAHEIQFNRQIALKLVGKHLVSVEQRRYV